MGKAMKPKTCRACKAKFAPSKPMQAVCGPKCAQAYATMQREKKAAQEAAKRTRETREELERRKTLPVLIAEADKAFCAWVRERDEGLPCICCGRYSSGWTRGGEWDGGHFRSRGAASHLRYDPRNCHKQLKQCNRRAWDVATYEANLVAKIGREQVESLKSDNRTHKWTRDEVRSIRDHYRAALRDLKRAKDHG